MRTIFEDQYLSFSEDPRRKLAIVARTADSPPTAKGMRATIDDFLVNIRPEHRSWGVVFDLRRARGSHDPEYLAAGNEAAKALLSSFHRTVVLVSSTAGLLQVGRRGRETGFILPATTREEDAIAYVTSAIDELPDPLRSRAGPAT